MPRGSAPGERRGGRKPGSLNKRTQEIAIRASADGETPLEYMLRVMRDARVETSMRNDMAKAAAPYIHPRLASTEIKGEGGGAVKIEIVKFDPAAK